METDQQCACKSSSVPYYRAARQQTIVQELKKRPLASDGTERTFTLMRLPPELRRQVYISHFAQPPVKIIGSSAFCGLDNCPLTIVNANVDVGFLILASKAVYDEAMPLFMACIQHVFSNVTDMARTLDRLGKFQRGHITDVSFAFCGSKSLNAFQMLSGCTRLQHLTIDVSEQIPEFRSFKSAGVLCESIGFSTLLKMRGLKTVKVIDRSSDARNPKYDDMHAFLDALKMLLEPSPDKGNLNGSNNRGGLGGRDLRKDFCKSGPVTRSRAAANNRIGNAKRS